MRDNSAPMLMDVTRLIWRRWAGVHPTGIDRTCLAYLTHFADRVQAVVQRGGFRRILDRDQSRRLFDTLLDPRGSTRGQLLSEGIGHALRAAANLSADERLYLNVGHTGLNDPAFVEWCTASRARPVYFVHDLIPLTHPEYCRAGEEEKHRQRILAALDTGVGIIGNSRATLAALRAFANSVERVVPPTLAAWLGVTPVRGTPPEGWDEGHPYFLMLGTIEARKNHLFILQLWTQLVAEMGAAAPRLKIVGRRGWECEQAVDLLERSPAVRSHVEELNDCDDRKLAELLHGARALLFPSFAEGFGLPVIEAMQAGLPVIASDLPIFEEVGRGLITLVNPLDGPGWKTVIKEYARPDSAARVNQITRLRSVHVPTWEDHFNRVEAWLPTLSR